MRRGGEGRGEAARDGGGCGGVRQVETDEPRWLLRQLETVAEQSLRRDWDVRNC